MPLSWTILALAILPVIGFVLGRNRAISSAGGDTRNLHSLPSYYGWSVALFTALPAILVMCVWLIVQPSVIANAVSGLLPEATPGDANAQTLVMTDVRRLAAAIEAGRSVGILSGSETAQEVQGKLSDLGVVLGAQVTPEILAAATAWGLMAERGGGLMSAVVLALALVGFWFSYRRITRDFRARNSIEAAIRAGLIACSVIAIATTAGIVLSMLFETGQFFRQYAWTEFFFGKNWQPNFRGNSDLGILPLLWGTLYISFIALAVAVPVGLFAAIYMSEYAGPKLRSFAKPAIEMLAGIPTIVYGLFALITVGPMLRDYFAQPLGFGSSASSVLTAGLVMGVMIIPFVSSLSDDIINAVPQSLRDGSLGLGATHSETIRQVVLPAALPGIVGAVLLAASRAIGETMIVVMGAGAAAKLSLNPFEAMTTITVKIVSQLTGDTDFAAPETLVAFALGLTLFAITLALNVLALYIVRKYREQYE